ncbi:MAG: T9SS type A sorting domain-containing protein, partial [Bacteroidia bacterium]
VKLDYDITDVPTDNQGMGNGNYIVGMQLFQYGEANFETDASIEMVKRPTDWEYYQRLNPACAQPIIVVKNTGSKEITSLEIEYTVSGGIKLTHTWNGSIQFLKSVEIDLPIDGSYFWVGDDAQIFTAKIINVNGQKDQNNENDIYSTHFQLPEIIKKQEFFIQLKTNNIPEENHYEIKDATGNVVYSLENLSANTVYRDTISLDYGCYTFELFDEGYGLSYWAWPDQGSGTLQMRYVGGGLIKSFDPDFGEKIYWPFAVGTVSTILEGEYKPTIQAYPNPTSGKLNIEVNNLNERYLVQMVDVTGKQVYNNIVEGKGLDLLKVDLSSANSGVYLLKITSQTNTYSKRVIIE